MERDFKKYVYFSISSSKLNNLQSDPKSDLFLRKKEKKLLINFQEKVFLVYPAFVFHSCWGISNDSKKLKIPKKILKAKIIKILV